MWRRILRITVAASLLATAMFLPLIRVTYLYTYVILRPDGEVEVERDSWSEWITPYEYVTDVVVPRILGGGELGRLKEALNKVSFKQPFIETLRCGEKSAIIMKYLKGLGFKVEMGRGKLKWGTMSNPHGWVLVHIGKKTYVIETAGQTGTPYIVGTVEEASKGPLKYIEEERWSMEKVERHYGELLKKKLGTYLKIER